MNYILVLLILPFLTLAHAQEKNQTYWRFEATMAALAMRQSKSPLIGPTALVRTSDNFSLGLRALMSLVGTANESIAQGSFVQRYHFSTDPSSIFLELNEGYNQVHRKRYFPSAGGSIGINHEIGNFYSIGGLTGLEADLGSDKTSVVYPKVFIFLAIKL
jgi:hypothetical protein